MKHPQDTDRRGGATHRQDCPEAAPVPDDRLEMLFGNAAPGRSREVSACIRIGAEPSHAWRNFDEAA